LAGAWPRPVPLTRKATQRALLALTRFRALISQMKVEEVFAFATAAARDASNGQEFISQARKILKTEIALFTGRQEAMYAARGVLSAWPGC
jgi:exopolyphosphatase/guanosine-5'-triphosphate,3'-diphosphate pyrophosphatase